MAKPKYDGVIEVARYAPEGQIVLVRAYERRGATFSDRELWTRAELVLRLKAGQKIVTGERTPLLASTFKVKSKVRLGSGRGREVIVAGKEDCEHDLLDTPLF